MLKSFVWNSNIITKTKRLIYASIVQDIVVRLGELSFRFGSSWLEKVKKFRTLKIINVIQGTLQKIEHIKLKWTCTQNESCVIKKLSLIGNRMKNDEWVNQNLTGRIELIKTLKNLSKNTALNRKYLSVVCFPI